MPNFSFPVKSFQKFDEPHNDTTSRSKYRFYIEVKDIPAGLLDWMRTNPREQNLSTDVARSIESSLRSSNKSFHLLNRGVLFSASEVLYDEDSSEAIVTLTDPNTHGNIDGGHTLRAVYKHLEYVRRNPNLYQPQYLEFEIITGVASSIGLASARNTSLKVDTKSIEELRHTFDPVKQIIENKSIKGNFYGRRIIYKQNQHHDELLGRHKIDIRAIICIISMFSPTIFPTNGTHPTGCFQGKEATLKRFLYAGISRNSNENDIKTARENEIEKMSNIIPEIFQLWDKIECDLPVVSRPISKRYAKFDFSRYKEDENRNPTVVSWSTFSNTPMSYAVPSSILFPIVGAFRTLIIFDEETNKYKWSKNPFIVWNNIKRELVTIVLDMINEWNGSLTALAKSVSTWDRLFNKIYIYSIQSQEQQENSPSTINNNA